MSDDFADYDELLGLAPRVSNLVPEKDDVGLMSLDEAKALVASEPAPTRKSAPQAGASPPSEVKRQAAIHSLKHVCERLASRDPSLEEAFVKLIDETSKAGDLIMEVTAWFKTANPGFLRDNPGVTINEIRTAKKPTAAPKDVPIWGTLLGQASDPEGARMVIVTKSAFGKTITFPPVPERNLEAASVDVDESSVSSEILGIACAEQIAKDRFPEVFEHSRPLVSSPEAAVLLRFFNVKYLPKVHKIQLALNAVIGPKLNRQVTRLLANYKTKTYDVVKEAPVGMTDPKLLLIYQVVNNKKLRDLAQSLLKADDLAHVGKLQSAVARFTKVDGPLGGAPDEEIKKFSDTLQKVGNPQEQIYSVSVKCLETALQSRKNREDRAVNPELDRISKSAVRALPLALDTTVSKVDRVLAMAKHFRKVSTDPCKRVFVAGVGDGTFLLALKHHFPNAVFDFNDLPSEQEKVEKATLLVDKNQRGELILQDFCTIPVDSFRKYDALIFDAKAPHKYLHGPSKVLTTWVEFEENADLQTHLLKVAAVVPISVFAFLMPVFKSRDSIDAEAMKRHMVLLMNAIKGPAGTEPRGVTWVHPNRLHQWENWVCIGGQPSEAAPGLLSTHLVYSAANRISVVEPIRMKFFYTGAAGIVDLEKSRMQAEGRMHQYLPAVRSVIEGQLRNLKPPRMGKVSEPVELPVPSVERAKISTLDAFFES